MSLVADSPVNSSSSDDFATLLDAELASTPSEESPDLDDDGCSGDDVEQVRIKRQKVEDLEDGDTSLGSGGAITSQLDAPESSTSEKLCPPHPGFYRDMCIRCGHVKEAESGITLGYIHKHLRLESDEITRIRHVDLEKKLKRDKKLYLVLDLDHTLLNSTRLMDITPEEEHLKQGDLSVGLHRLDNMHMLTKLRPSIDSFLSEAFSMFEMYIYTMGERSYALEIAKLLDPKGKYFSDRVISQGDCTQRHQKGLDVVFGAENAVLILDDTETVWQKHRDNLILMERYHYFASSCRQFGFCGKSLSERKTDESVTDGALSRVLKILMRVHQMFFLNMEVGSDINQRDVRPMLKTIRKEVLKDCKLVFSHVFPKNFQAPLHPLWKMAEQLGATCCTDVDSSVTHVVAMDRGTDKARWAVKENKFLVNTSWIEAANYLWQRQPEENFEVSIPKVRQSE